MIAASSSGWAADTPQPRGATAAPSKSQRAKVSYDANILGPRDSLQVELLDIPELSGTFSIGPDGTMYLPRLRALYVEGLTVEELRYLLTEQFKTYVKNPQLYVRPVRYRPIRIYVGGEVRRPGYYMLSGSQVIQDQLKIQESASPNSFRTQSSSLKDFQAARLRLQRSATDDVSVLQGISATPNRWPTLFDALCAAQGVTPYSDLAQVKVVRKPPLSQGRGKAQAQVNILELVTQGDESVNIRLFDGDVISVGRSKQVLRDQLLAAGTLGVAT